MSKNKSGCLTYDKKKKMKYEMKKVENFIPFYKSKRMFMFNRTNQDENFKILLNYPADKLLTYIKEPNSKSLCLINKKNLTNIFQVLPKKFKITTLNGSSNFNIEILKIASPIISSLLQKDSNVTQYHIDIEDEKGFLVKLEQLFQGQAVIIAKDECFNFIKFLNLLKIKVRDDSNKPINNLDLNRAMIDINALIQNLKKDHSFTIKTNKREYQCSSIGINSSLILNEFIKSNPESNVYSYDFSDEFGEFQPICDFFNFEKVSITTKNMDSIKEIAEELKISPILNEINNFLDDYEKFTEILDEQQESADQINDLFDLLSNIRQKTVKTVKDEILESNWSKTVEDVQELASFILQIIDSNLLVHKDLIDLLIELDSESNDTNKLNILIPIIVKNLMKSFGKNIQNCSFIHHLSQKGFISKDEIIENVNKKAYQFEIEIDRLNQPNINNFTNNPNINNGPLHNFSFRNNNQNQKPIKKKVLKTDTCILLWFLPEIIESKSLKNAEMLEGYGKCADSFVKSYFYKIDSYKKMRDSGEPDDELTLALRYDDVDKFQSIISNGQLHNQKGTVPYNMYEEFVPNGLTRYLNYSAAYGSIKCFKYLLLNHEKIDKHTFKFAVYGGNFEIIKIVDQKISEDNIDNDVINVPPKKAFNLNGNQLFANRQRNWNSDFTIVNNFIENVVLTSKMIYSIVPSIIKHQNDLFDWILAKSEINIDFDSFSDLISISIESGNAHSFTGLLEKCFEDAKNYLFDTIIEDACRKGYYRLLKILVAAVENLMSQNDQALMLPNSSNNGYNLSLSYKRPIVDPRKCTKIYIISFGNLSILKLFIPKLVQEDLENILAYAFYDGNVDIVKYIFDLAKKNSFQFTEQNIDIFILHSLSQKNGYLYDYLIEQIKALNPSIFENIKWSISYVNNAAFNNNVKAAKDITNIIFKENPNEDFRDAFLNAVQSNSTELCQFFIDKKVFISFENLKEDMCRISNISKDIFPIISNNFPSDIFHDLCKKFVEQSIYYQNEYVLENVLKELPESDNVLIKAVETHDPKIVKIILKYINKPKFINKRTPNGTALCIAVQNDDFEIVQLLISVPEIDVNLYDSFKNTPLIIAANNFNLEIFNLILDYYGDDIKYQQWQIDVLVEKALYLLISPNSEQDAKIEPVINRILEIKYIESNIFDKYFTEFCNKNNVEAVKRLLDLDKTNPNIYDPQSGNTNLINAIRNSNLIIAELLIKHPKTNINFRNNSDETPLTIAVSHSLNGIVEQLINDEKFDKEESLFNYAFCNSNPEITKILMNSKYLDINDDVYTLQNHPFVKISNYGFFMDKSNETMLIYAVKEQKEDLIDIIIQHPNFDIKKSKLNQAILESLKESKNINIFNKLIQKSDLDEFNKTYVKDALNWFAIYNESSKSKNSVSQVLSAVLNTPGLVFDKDCIINTFGVFFDNYFSFASLNVDSLIVLIDFDRKHNNFIDLNKLRPNGKSCWTSSFKKDPILFDFLLKNDVDPNIQDKFGVYPLQFQFYLKSFDNALKLINSGKIDFNKKIPDFNLVGSANIYESLETKNTRELRQSLNDFYSKGQYFSKKNFVNYTTYLHIAAGFESSEALKQILDKKVIDVNAEDYLGNTPLMDACRFNQGANVEILFKMDDLDYLHKNKEGKDALHILDPSLPENDEEIKSKNDYLMKLMIYLDTPEPNLKSNDNSSTWGSSSNNSAWGTPSKNFTWGSSKSNNAYLGSSIKVQKANVIPFQHSTPKQNYTNSFLKKSRTVFFSNIPFNYSVDKFKEFVQSFGQTSTINCIFSKGVAFVTYNDIRDSEKAKEKANGSFLDSRPIKTSFALHDQISSESCSTILVRSNENPSKIELQEVIQKMKVFGDIMWAAVEGQPFTFVVEYYNILDARKAMKEQFIQIGSEKVKLEYKIENENKSDYIPRLKQVTPHQLPQIISKKPDLESQNLNMKSDLKSQNLNMKSDLESPQQPNRLELYHTKKKISIDANPDSNNDGIHHKRIKRRTVKHAIDDDDDDIPFYSRGTFQMYQTPQYIPNGIFQQQSNLIPLYNQSGFVQPQIIQYPHNYQSGTIIQQQMNLILISRDLNQERFNQQMIEQEQLMNSLSRHRKSKRKK